MHKPTRILSITLRIAIFGGLIAFILNPTFGPRIRGQSKVKFSLMEMTVFTASMESYKIEFGSYPTGDNRTILGVLQGNNPKKLIFLDIHPRSISPDGAFVDPWQTPYEINVISTNHLSIRSAGKNKRFGDTDDVTNSP